MLKVMAPFAQGLFGGRFGMGELLIIVVIFGGFGLLIVRPFWRLLWAIIHKLEK